MLCGVCLVVVAHEMLGVWLRPLPEAQMACQATLGRLSHAAWAPATYPPVLFFLCFTFKKHFIVMKYIQRLLF